MDSRTAEVAEQSYNRKLELKRSQHENAKERLLDARSRLYGVDVQALERQVADKKAMEAADKAEDNSYAAYLQRVNVRLTELEIQEKEEKARQAAELRNTWSGQRITKEELTRQMNAPCAQPFGVSSAQAFDGEDLGSKARKKLQAEQMGYFSKLQEDEKKQRRLAEKAENADYAAFVQQLTRARNDIEKNEMERRNERAREVQRANLQMAAEARQRKLKERKDEARQNALDVETTKQHSLFSADPILGKSSLGLNRLRPDHYKGFTKEEDIAYRRSQRLQMEEAKARKAEEKRREDDWARANDALVARAEEVSYMQNEQKLEDARLLMQHRDEQVRARRERELREEADNK